VALRLTERDGALEFTAYVRPGASRESVGGLREQALQVQVRARPAEGAANRAVCKAVARALGVPKTAVELLSGARSRRKRLRVRGDPQLLAPALRALGGNPGPV
jgi:uncharacterized protein (TIGR00251 family)